nr:iron-containing alcohol dehydrogenase [Desulfurococcales archaeon]
TLPASAPKHLYLWTALDALAHAVEALASTGATPFSDALALHAAEIIFVNLKRALEGDDEARSLIHAAATMAGMAFTNGGLGLAHAIAHPLGAALHTHHGATVGIVLPRVVELNYSDAGARKKYETLKSVLENIDGLPRASSLTEHLYRLYEKVGAPRGLRDLGVEREKVEDVAAWVAEEALHDPDIAYAPVVPSPEELEKLILSLY